MLDDSIRFDATACSFELVALMMTMIVDCVRAGTLGRSAGNKRLRVATWNFAGLCTSQAHLNVCTESSHVYSSINFHNTQGT